jgi:ParB-like chromosome segregation protein Spo0J
MVSKTAQPPTISVSGFQIRILRYDTVPCKLLVPHPLNWRTHPEAQQSATRSQLLKIGWVDALKVRDLGDGSFQIIDGHLRASLSPDDLVPVLVIDITESEAEEVLLTFDPITSMAEIDQENLEALLSRVDVENADLRSLMDELDDGPAFNELESENAATKQEQKMELRPHEHYDFVVILANDAMTWNELCERLGIKSEPLFSRKKTKYGISRAVKAETVLALLQNNHPEPHEIEGD